MSSEKIDLGYDAPSIHPDKPGVYTSKLVLTPFTVTPEIFNNIYISFQGILASNNSASNGAAYFGIFPYRFEEQDEMYKSGFRNACYETFFTSEETIQIECFGIWKLKTPIIPQMFKDENPRIRRIDVIVSTSANQEGIHARVKKNIEMLVNHANISDI